jgi:protein arginine kinase activator
MKFQKCFFCNKLKFAPYHVTEIEKGQAQLFDMCASCGETYTKDLETKSPKGTDLTKITNTEQLLNFISGVGVDIVSPKSSMPPCECGMTEEVFDKIGRFGCVKCYEHFSIKMEQLVYPYHGAKLHVGKRPKRQIKEKLENDPIEKQKVLKLKYAKALELEDYEAAAQIKKELDLSQ